MTTTPQPKHIDTHNCSRDSGETGSPMPSPSHDEDLPAVPTWLDEIDGEAAMAWVRERNDATRSHFEGCEDFECRRTDIEAILNSPDTIPAVSCVSEWLYNYWTDAEHPRGLWRRTTWESYRAGSPQAGGHTQWEILLDLDALGADEGVAWVWHGASVLRTGPLAGRRALINLSDGGSDTDVTREFDLDTLSFVDPAAGGFTRPASKGAMTWADDEGQSVLVLTDWGEESISSAGYPRQVRLLQRGGDLAQAPILLSASPTSNGVHAYRDRHGRTWLTEHTTFFTSRTWLLPHTATPVPAETSAEVLAKADTTVAQGAVLMEVPASAEVEGAWDELLVYLHEPWTVGEQTYPTGSVLAAPLEGLTCGQVSVEALFIPTEHTFIRSWTRTAHHLVLALLDDVVDSLLVLTPPQEPGGSWASRACDLAGLLPYEVDGCGASAPTAGMSDGDGLARVADSGDSAQAGESEAGTPTTDGETSAHAPQDDPTLLRPGRPLIQLSAHAVDSLNSDALWLTTSSFITPTTMAWGTLDSDGQLHKVEVLRAAPARFDASGVVVTQHVATSADGTHVPYFQIGRPSAHPTPTILYGYGGFEVPLTVGYAAVTGSAWLETGGTYVVANLRGGGEYGPAWHRAGLKEYRHRIYEDCAAIAQELIRRGVTTPAQLAVHGGSNGGLLVGNMMTQYPHLFGAVICEVPLLDMQRYTHLLAGTSWEAEYGDPDDPAQWEFVRTFSPFHLLRRGQDYPPVLFVTSTRDDRVHPAHARTMAYRMLALGHNVTFFENPEGGHGRAATNAQRAWMSALIHTFAWRTLTAESSQASTLRDKPVC